MLNDIHGQAQFMKELCKNIDFESIDLVIFNGDMSSSIHSEEQIFSDFMDAAVDLFAKRVPVAFTRGNHETADLCRLFNAIFSAKRRKNIQVI